MNRANKVGLVVGVVAVLVYVVPQALAVFTTQRANLGAQRLVTQTQRAATTTSSTEFVTLTTTTIQVPAGQTARLVARFSGESNCTQGPPRAWCSLRILADGVEMSPGHGSGFAFDSVGEGASETCTPNCGWESHSIDRTSKVLSSGTHTVTVERSVTSSSTVFSLGDWQLTVESWRVS